MITVSMNNQDMILTVEGLHKVWALKSQMSIPKQQVVSARINHNEITKPKGWRAPGTYIPGLITAGTYRAIGNKVFWDVVHYDQSIIVDLRDSDYQQLILEVKNPEAIVAEINQWVLDV